MITNNNVKMLKFAATHREMVKKTKCISKNVC